MLEQFLSILANFLPEQTAVDPNAFVVPWAVIFEAPGTGNCVGICLGRR